MRFTILLLAGLLTANAEEILNRGLIAVLDPNGHVYLGWRLLKSDPAGVAFNVYRTTPGGKPARLNSKPIVDSTNLVDAVTHRDPASKWFVRPVVRGREQAPSESATLQNFAIKLDGAYLFNRVGIGDLDGDGVFDYVIKQPGAVTASTPARSRQSPDTFKLEAYNGRTGKFMWRYDLGWNMNMGVWWTPYVVATSMATARPKSR